MDALILESSSDTLEVARNEDGFWLEIDNPWYGSTDTGFGASLSIQLTQEQMEQLIAWASEKVKLIPPSSLPTTPA